MYCFINDDRAILEPQNDIFATALLVLGFVIFACVVSKTYIAHQDSSFALENYEQASLLHRESPIPRCSRVADKILYLPKSLMG
jgi:hypothetical protein